MPLKGPRRESDHYAFEMDQAGFTASWMTSEMQEWLTTVKGDVAVVLRVAANSGYTEQVLAFSESSDAVLYKLTWGGK